MESWSKDQLKSIGVKILIELLAYQFASPVRWIETQDYFFRNNVDRVIELGPAPTLADMAKRYLNKDAFPLIIIYYGIKQC
jgi:malonyl CoA-acyl carrier protein transacylase